MKQNGIYRNAYNSNLSAIKTESWRERKMEIKISKNLKDKLDNIITKKGETYDDIINGLLEWKWYKQRNKILEENLKSYDDEVNEYLEEIAELQKKIKSLSTTKATPSKHNIRKTKGSQKK